MLLLSNIQPSIVQFELPRVNEVLLNPAFDTVR